MNNWRILCRRVCALKIKIPPTVTPADIIYISEVIAEGKLLHFKLWKTEIHEKNEAENGILPEFFIDVSEEFDKWLAYIFYPGHRGKKKTLKVLKRPV